MGENWIEANDNCAPDRASRGLLNSAAHSAGLLQPIFSPQVSPEQTGEQETRCTGLHHIALSSKKAADLIPYSINALR
jgi:hypothetical protein